MPKKIVTTTVVTEEVVENNDVLVKFVLDKSGSMMGIAHSTISGFNEYVATQKAAKVEGQTYFSLNQFADVSKTTIPYAKIEDVLELNSDTYRADGPATALYDSIDAAITEVENIGEKPSRILFVVLTDGLENASRKATRESVLERITSKKAQGWEFVFLGANMDSYTVGASMGYSSGSTMNWAATQDGVKMAFNNISTSTTLYRSATASSYNVGSFFQQGNESQTPS